MAPESGERRGRSARRRVVRHLRLGGLLALIATGPLLVLVASVLVGALAAAHEARVQHELLDQVQPAQAAALRLESAVLNQETGIRGYQLTGDKSFLAPYLRGVAEERMEARRLARTRIRGVAGPLFVLLARVGDWQRLVAVPAVLQTAAEIAHGGPVRRGRGGVTGGGGGGGIDIDRAGKHRFDAIRSAVAVLEGVLSRRVGAARRDLEASDRTTELTLIVIAVALLLAVAGAWLALRRWVNAPLSRLTAGSRRVAAGELEHSLLVDGPADIEALAADVDAMRGRLVEELDAVTAARNELVTATAELERSNRDLEQFAYVASHDLQEPLRKVTSFVQLLQERYQDRLDDRADQYIGFAVDGASRMQQLIGDLLAFSRVGRRGAERTSADLGRLARAAVSDLDELVRSAGAEIEIGPLPELPVESALIRTVFQNLISNAIKFRRAEVVPRVWLGAELDEASAEWQLHCTDNGIGIEPEYAERIFVIFQRLHSRERYPGTGIGLAMCRRIIEYHGGRIWLDTAYPEGTRIVFTLPA
jgi:signal transduction histidine kinase